MSAWLESFATGFRQQDSRPLSAWARDYVEPPNAARCKRLDVSVTPWLQEPTDRMIDPAIKYMVCLMPTGAGKTTLFDALIPYSISEDPGGILLVQQTDEDAKEYMEERLMPSLHNIEQIRHIFGAMSRHAIRKDAIMFPHMPFYSGGANLTHLQRKSVRRCLGDEVWRWKHGYVREMEARTHDRWNQFVLLVSQGGVTHIQTDKGLIETELENRWQMTTRSEWQFQCPECATFQRYRLKALRYESRLKDDGTLDESAVMQSARYSCQHCPTEFPDTIQMRRSLAMSGRYEVTNPKAIPGRIGYHCNGLTLYYVPWAKIALELAQAHHARKFGDEDPIKIFRQKRMAENYREEDAAAPSPMRTGDYSMLDLQDTLWDGECRRLEKH